MTATAAAAVPVAARCPLCLATAELGPGAFPWQTWCCADELACRVRYMAWLCGRR